ncbi:MAG: 3-deoxy-D-manno-octulosonic acid transferase [Flavobacteriales bacterium]|nr:3-deoxy-D-manno-octulosonic acid transferase [Flavobacteriales bacterium]
MLSLYTFVTRIFLGLAPLFKWTSAKFAIWVSTRGQWKEDAQSFKKSGKVVWFHCASVGEFEQARPLIEGMKKENQGVQVIVTFFSSSGYEVRNDYALADVVTYLPADLPGRMRDFIACIQPDLVVFVKYEFWFNAMEQLQQKDIPMILVSAHITDKHWTTQWPGIYLGRRLRQFTRIFTQDEATVKRLESIGIFNAAAVGDTRVDRVISNAEQGYDLQGIEAFKGECQLLVIGSNWSSDDAIILDAVKTRNNLKLIVAPHEINADQLDVWKHQFGRELVKFSEIEQTPGWEKATVLYVDRIGFLSKLYRFGDVAYVGGGFGKAVHNTLEASVYGIPVLFGPKNMRFQEVQELKALGAGLEVESAESFRISLEKALVDTDFRKDVNAAAATYFERQRGASSSILKWVNERLHFR